MVIHSAQYDWLNILQELVSHKQSECSIQMFGLQCKPDKNPSLPVSSSVPGRNCTMSTNSKPRSFLISLKTRLNRSSRSPAIAAKCSCGHSRSTTADVSQLSPPNAQSTQPV